MKRIDLEPLAMLIWYEVAYMTMPYHLRSRLDWRADRKQWIGG